PHHPPLPPRRPGGPDSDHPDRPPAPPRPVPTVRHRPRDHHHPRLRRPVPRDQRHGRRPRHPPLHPRPGTESRVLPPIAWRTRLAAGDHHPLASWHYPQDLVIPGASSTPAVAVAGG